MYNDTLNYKKILENTPDKEELSVTLKKTANKGVGLFATKPIRKGDVIAFYKLKVHHERNFVSPTQRAYSCYIYNRNGKMMNNLVADLYEHSVPEPRNGIPYWAHFANEPSVGERCNSELNTNLKYNYRDRTRIKVGDTVLYELRATRYISPGEEVLWWYGDTYHRDYIVSKL